MGCRAELLALRAERIELWELDGSCRWSRWRDGGRILRHAEDDRQCKRVRCGQQVFAGCGLKLEMGRGLELEGLELEGLELEWASGSDAGRGLAQRLVEAEARRAGGWVGLVGHAKWPARSRSEDRPLHAERIRCSWGAWECAAMEPVGHAGWPTSSRAEARPLHLKPPQLERWGAEREVRVGGRVGSGSRSCR